MIAISNDIIASMTVLAGDVEKIDDQSSPVWSRDRVDFLEDLSRRLLSNELARTLPDVVTFAYYIRKSNLQRLYEAYAYKDRLCMGLGLVFHVCPSNVPVNFAYSMMFGLLAGNSCVLKLPSKENKTITSIVHVINALLLDAKHTSIARSLLLIRYGHEDDVNAFWLSRANGRVIWGGGPYGTVYETIYCATTV